MPMPVLEMMRLPYVRTRRPQRVAASAAAAAQRRATAMSDEEKAEADRRNDARSNEAKRARRASSAASSSQEPAPSSTPPPASAASEQDAVDEPNVPVEPEPDEPDETAVHGSAIYEPLREGEHVDPVLRAAARLKPRCEGCNERPVHDSCRPYCRTCKNEMEQL